MDDINLRLIKALNSQKIYNKLGLAAIRIMRKRTRNSQDVKGQQFELYSRGYAAKRKRAGLANPAKVTMEFSKTGGMLAAIDYEVFEVLGDQDEFGYAEVSIKDPLKAQLAYYHNISGAGKGRVIREFWGIELDEEITQLETLANKEARDVLIKEIGDILADFDKQSEG